VLSGRPAWQAIDEKTPSSRLCRMTWRASCAHSHGKAFTLIVHNPDLKVHKNHSRQHVDRFAFAAPAFSAFVKAFTDGPFSGTYAHTDALWHASRLLQIPGLCTILI
jgi:hypothetical protein